MNRYSVEQIPISCKGFETEALQEYLKDVDDSRHRIVKVQLLQVDSCVIQNKWIIVWEAI